MSGPPPTLRAFLAGSSGSGKSTTAWRLYMAKYPRRLLLDYTGEWSERRDEMAYPGPDRIVYDVPELSHALHELAPRGRWTISVEIGLEQFGDMVDYLFPLSNLDRSPIRLCGGAVILMDEVDLVAPPRGLKQEVRTLWRRSRHVGLSVIATTQRPEAVSREVTGQSHHIVCLHLLEPKALTYMADFMQADLSGLRAWWARHPHGGLWKEPRSGRALWLQESGQLVQPSTPQAQPQPRAASVSVEPAPLAPGQAQPVEDDQEPSD